MLMSEVFYLVSDFMKPQHLCTYTMKSSFTCDLVNYQWNFLKFDFEFCFCSLLYYISATGYWKGHGIYSALDTVLLHNNLPQKVFLLTEFHVHITNGFDKWKASKIYIDCISFYLSFISQSLLHLMFKKKKIYWIYNLFILWGELGSDFHTLKPMSSENLNPLNILTKPFSLAFRWNFWCNCYYSCCYDCSGGAEHIERLLWSLYLITMRKQTTLLY